MEILILGIYSFFVWLVFIKLKWLPWNIVSQVIVITLPIIGLTITILLLNIVAPSSHDIRVVNYVVPINPPVRGLVTEVPVEPNRAIKKGDVLFKIDPVPYEIKVQAAQAKVVDLEAAVVGATAGEREIQEQQNVAAAQRQAAESRLPGLKAQIESALALERNLKEQLKSAGGKRQAVSSRIELAHLRVGQFRELAATGAGNKFDLEQAEAEARTLEADLASAQADEGQITQKLSARTESGELADIAQARAQFVQAESDVASAKANEAQLRQKLSARTPAGELASIAQAKAALAQAQAELSDAKWELSQTTYYAPANGRVIALTLRPGAMAVPLPMTPAMNFVEDEQWILAIYKQNEVRQIEPGQEAEVAFEMYPGRLVKCAVDSIMWATAQGQLPIGSGNAAGGVAPIPPNCVAVRLLTSEKEGEVFLASGAHGAGAVYTDSLHEVQILRKVLVRVDSKLNWLILKLH